MSPSSSFEFSSVGGVRCLVAAASSIRPPIKWGVGIMSVESVNVVVVGLVHFTLLVIEVVEVDDGGG